MDIVLKTILYSYPTFKREIERLEKLVMHKALTSYCDCSKTYEQINYILSLNGKIRRIKELNNIVNGFLQELTQRERLIIAYKYFKIMPPANFDYTSRIYFREQKRVFNKLLKKMQKKGYDELWFVNNYFDIFTLKESYYRIKNYTNS